MGKQKQLQRDPSLPRSIGIWGDELKKIALPAGAFDPTGPWSQLYSQYSLGPFNRQWRGAFRVMGALRLERKPLDGGGFAQTGRRVTQMVGKTWLSIDWTADYEGDRLATPRQWAFASDLLFNERPVDKDFRYPDAGPTAYQQRPLPMATAKHRFTGKIENNAVVNEGIGRIALAPGVAVAANWGVFEAVQRLAPSLDQPLTFDLIEDFDLHKPAQALRAGPAMTIEFASGPVRLHSFHQIGRGVLPWEYWVSDQGRLVLALGGYRGYVLNPNEPIGGKMI